MISYNNRLRKNHGGNKYVNHIEMWIVLLLKEEILMIQDETWKDKS